jgi:hypothetical protein
MDKIGSSYIALPDLIIFGLAIALLHRLTTLPPNSLLCRVLAVLSGFIVLAIIVVIPVANNLTHSGVFELSFAGIGLAIGLLKWNDARVESKLASPPLDSQNRSI